MKFIVLTVFLLIFIEINQSISSDNTLSKEVYTESTSYNQNDKKAQIASEISKSRFALPDVIDRVSPAIVGINVTEIKQVSYGSSYNDPIIEYFFGRQSRQTRQYEVKSLGSGYIISSDGYVLTNHHVAGNASKIVVTLTNGEKYNADIIGTDVTSDVCLLKIDTKSELPFLVLGNSNETRVGEWVLALGNPFGLFDINTKPTVTIGIVSNKSVSFVEQDRQNLRIYKDMIQTDAAISSGNSGGPLVNVLGEVVGMNTIIWSTAQSNAGSGSIGIGFAIPINIIKTIVSELKLNGTIDRDFNIGMDVSNMDERIARYLKTEITDAVVVFEFDRNSKAQEAGLKLGDIILEINGFSIRNKDQYIIAMGCERVGNTVDFKVLRDGNIVDIKLKLERNENNSKVRIRN